MSRSIQTKKIMTFESNLSLYKSIFLDYGINPKWDKGLGKFYKQVAKEV